MYRAIPRTVDSGSVLFIDLEYGAYNPRDDARSIVVYLGELWDLIQSNSGLRASAICGSDSRGYKEY